MRIFKTLLLTFFIVVASCKENNSEKNKSTNKNKEKVTITMVTFPGYAPLYLALEKDMFKGIDVELVRIEDIGQIRAAMQSGKIDIYAATYDIFQSTKGKKPTGVGFLAIDESHGGDGIVVTDNINGILDFQGKKVAAEPGFPPYFILEYLLDKEGMTLKDVDFNDLSSQDAGTAFIAKQFDIVGTYEPYLSTCIEKREGAKILYSSKDVSGLIVDWLFANPDLVKNNPKVLESISDGWFKALKFIESNPEEAYAIMGDAFGMSADDMKDFKTGITWLNLDDNLYMHNISNTNNAYAIFKKVGDILEKNDETNMRLIPQEHLSSKIVDALK